MMPANLYTGKWRQVNPMDNDKFDPPPWYVMAECVLIAFAFLMVVWVRELLTSALCGN
jgi:hypothetical protein